MNSLPVTEGGLACITERFVAPLFTMSERFEFGKLADESDVPALSNHPELDSAFELEVVA